MWERQLTLPIMLFVFSSNIITTNCLHPFFHNLPLPLLLIISAIHMADPMSSNCVVFDPLVPNAHLVNNTIVPNGKSKESLQYPIS